MGLTQSVAPNFFAMSNFVGFVSIAKIRFAFLAWHAWMAARPTAPSPNTAAVEFSSTLQVFHTAPRPVLTPQPKRQTLSRAAPGSIFAHEISATTVYSENVEHPMK